MAIDLDLADALATALNSEISGLGAAAVFQTDVERDGLTAQQVHIVVAELEETPVNRLENEEAITLHIAIFRPITNPGDTSELRTALDAVDAIKNLWASGGALRATRLAGMAWRRLANEPRWSPDHLTRNIFASKIAVTYARAH